MLFKSLIIKYRDDEPKVEKGGSSELELLKKIKELKENSVSLDEYNRLKEEKNQIINQVLNGENIENEEQDTRSVDDIRKTLFGKGAEKLSNREYIENALALREKVIAEGGLDPFLPYGSKIQPDTNDVETVERIVETLQDCIKSANGDDDAFNVAFTQRLVEPPMAKVATAIAKQRKKG